MGDMEKKGIRLCQTYLMCPTLLPLPLSRSLSHAKLMVSSDDSSVPCPIPLMKSIKSTVFRHLVNYEFPAHCPGERSKEP